MKEGRIDEGRKTARKEGSHTSRFRGLRAIYELLYKTNNFHKKRHLQHTLRSRQKSLFFGSRSAVLEPTSVVLETAGAVLRSTSAVLDLKNAFNCIDRCAMLAAVRRTCPSIVPWIDFCYSKPSHLRLGKAKLFSEL